MILIQIQILIDTETDTDIDTDTDTDTDNDSDPDTSETGSCGFLGPCWSGAVCGWRRYRWWYIAALVFRKLP